MANAVLTHSMIAQRAVFDLKNNLRFAQNVYTGYKDEFHARGRYQVGSSVSIQLPQKFRAKDGATFDGVNLKEPETTVTVDKQKHVGLEFTENDLTFEIEDFSTKYTNPAMIALANKIDADGLAEYVNISNLVGTPGVTPATYGVLTNAAARLDNLSVPRSPRIGVVSSKTKWALADGELKSVFEENTVKRLITDTFWGSFADIDWQWDQNTVSHTVGEWGTDSPVMNGATAEGATSLVTDAWTASKTVLKQGDVITVAAVVGVNPVSGQAWEGGELRDFVVTADVTSDAGGNATIPISPTIYSSAAGEDDLPFQTVVTLPANEAAITVRSGASTTEHVQNLIFHPDCFALTVLPFAKPKSANQSVMWETATDEQLGLSVTISTGYDIKAFTEATRMDVLYGWDTIREDLGVRMTG